MREIPFAEELLNQPPTVVPSETVETIPPDIQLKLQLDPMQLRACELALQQRVTVVQGPPGTGKTYVGLHIVKALLRNNPEIRILCLCYTNHALDNFIEGLLDDGVPTSSIARLGSTSKMSARVKECSVQRDTTQKFNRTQHTLHMGYSAMEDEIVSQMNNLIKPLLSLTKLWFRDFERLVRGLYTLEGQYDYVLEQLRLDRSFNDGGFDIVTKDNKKVNQNTLWEVWIAGKPKPPWYPRNSRGSNVNPDIWKLKLQERLDIVNNCLMESKLDNIDIIVRLIDEFAQTIGLHSELRETTKVCALRSKQIIAATTTFAAKYHNQLEAYEPTVVLVEEAAEILEAHILTNLCQGVERLILIGDHLQLRPKVELYPLRTESGQGIDFDKSLFERLVKGGYPYVTLTVQHRMRPEISQFIRHTYPGLVDGPKVSGRENIKGVVSNVVFIDHRELERSHDKPSSLEPDSKINDFEISMILKVLRYLFQQGYDGRDIVVLTPYLGQLMAIKRALQKSKDLDIELGDRDQTDVEKGGLDDEDQDEQANASKSPQKTVRVATIDNYQGEESKIVIASLVRSNDNYDIGFVSGAERVNVLFSRARDGFILIGNSETFCNARSSRGSQLWSRLIDDLRNRGYMYTGFPAKCVRHGTMSLMSTPQQFEQLVPDGGCNLRCNVALVCGHICPKKCHMGNDHSAVICTEVMEVQCHRGLHPIQKPCANRSALICKRTWKYCCPNQHKTEIPCHLDKPSKGCKRCEEIEKKHQELDDNKKREFDELLKLQQETDEIEVQTLKVKSETEIAKQLHYALEMKKLKERELEAAKKHAEDLKKAVEEFNLPVEGDVRDNEDDMSTMKRRKVVRNDDSWPESLSSKYSSNSPNQAIVTEDTKIPATESPPERNDIPHKSTPIAATKVANSQPESNREPDKTDRRNDTKFSIGPSKDPEAPNPSTNSLADKLSALANKKKSGHTNKPGHTNSNNPGQLVTENPSLSAGSDRVSAPSVTSAVVPSVPEESGSDRELADLFSLTQAERWIDVFKRVQGLDPTISKDKISDPTIKHQRLDLLGFGLLALSHLGEDQQALLTGLKKLHNFLKTNTDFQTDISKLIALMSAFVSGVVYAKAKFTNLAQSEAGKFATFRSIFADVAEKYFPSDWGEIMNSISEDDATAGKTESKKEQPTNEIKSKWKQSKDVWKQGKLSSGQGGTAADTPSKAMDTLLEMTGLDSIKQKFLDLYQVIQISKVQAKDLLNSNFNCIFKGNPGTGKTTVAQLFSQFLTDVELLPKGCEILKKTGSELKNDGVNTLETNLKKLQENGGGVVFVDEAYQLDDNEGHRILDFILGHSEKLKGQFGCIVWIFAGYTKNMDKLLEHNVGLPSRFPHTFVFEDYTDEELLWILEGLMQRCGQDIVPPSSTPAFVAQVNPNKKVKTAKAPNRNMYGYAQNRPDEVDQWGNTWTWDPSLSTYEDDYDNISGYGPQTNTGSGYYCGYKLGTAQNPIVSRKDNRRWLFDPSKGDWYDQNNPATRQTYYPGKPPPAAPTPKVIQPFTVTNKKWTKIAIARLGKQRGVTGFGNARAVRNLFDSAHNRQSRRISDLILQGYKPDVFLFERDDFLGPKATMEALEACEAYQALLAMEGLQSVKSSINQLLRLVIMNADREERGERPLEVAFFWATLVPVRPRWRVCTGRF